jgi:hypothetical protein
MKGEKRRENGRKIEKPGEKVGALERIGQERYAALDRIDSTKGYNLTASWLHRQKRLPPCFPGLRLPAERGRFVAAPPVAVEEVKSWLVTKNPPRFSSKILLLRK